MNTEQETNIRMEESELNLGDILQTCLLYTSDAADD